MRALVIGGDGFVGSHLMAVLTARGHAVSATTRRRVLRVGNWFNLDLAQPVNDLPRADVAFIVAAVNTFQSCEGNREAYRVNVDAPIDIARVMIQRGDFAVFVSSDSVEWCGATAYARMKALAEIGVRLAGGAVVRPGRILPDRVSDLCHLLVNAGEWRQPTLYRWSGDAAA